MSYVIAEPQVLEAAAADLNKIGSVVSAASASAANPTSGLLAAAGDEVSTAIAKLFAAYGQEYQAAVGRAGALYQDFTQILAGAGLGYAGAEAANASVMANAATSIPPFSANLTSLFVGATGVPIPSQAYVNAANNLYVRAVGALEAVFTPEELYPITGAKSLPLNTSVQEGLTILDQTIKAQLAIPGNSVTVFGYSQGAIIESLEMEKLAAMGAGAPASNLLNFVLVGNEMNPNGGLLARFPDLTIPSLGLTFYGATPSNTIYPTAIYTLEYDGFADFPRYPINFVSDLNAVAGIAFVHTHYLDLSVPQVNGAIQLQTSPGYSGVTSYYVIPTENLPLLQPLRAIPLIGNPLADLMQPDLKVLVNLGYGDPAYGYSTSPADVHTTFGLFPHVPLSTIANDLSVGTQQGIQAFSADLNSMQAQPLTLPTFTPPAQTSLVSTLQSLPSPTKIVNTLSAVVSNSYADLLPTADIANALVTTLPVYDASLFVDQLSQGNLINAIGYPIAADIGLATVSGAVELLTVLSTVETNVQLLESLVP
jgi:PE-PPE domain/PE family